MRAEEKQVADQDLQRSEMKESLLEGDEKQLQQGLGNEREVSARDPELLAAVRDVLDKKPVIARALGLPERETKALEMLQTAVSARNHLDKWVYAEDRQQMLEQALAVLQPTLTSSHSTIGSDMRDDLADMIESLHALRTDLADLEDAQEDTIGSATEEEITTETDDDDDDDDAKPDQTDTAVDTQKAPASMFEGEQVEHPETPTKIWDDPAPAAIPAQKLKVVPYPAEPPTGPATESETDAARPAFWKRPRER